MSRASALIALILALAAGAVAPASADPVDPRPPTITAYVRGNQLYVRGHTLAAPGYVRLRFQARGTAEPYSLAVIELKRRESLAAVGRIPLAGLQTPTPSNGSDASSPARRSTPATST